MSKLPLLFGSIFDVPAFCLESVEIQTMFCSFYLLKTMNLHNGE